jgi:hypothetical protein
MNEAKLRNNQETKREVMNLLVDKSFDAPTVSGLNSHQLLEANFPQ